MVPLKEDHLENLESDIIMKQLKNKDKPCLYWKIDLYTYFTLLQISGKLYAIKARFKKGLIGNICEGRSKFVCIICFQYKTVQQLNFFIVLMF